MAETATHSSAVSDTYPELAFDDLYLYAHANGAITMLRYGGQPSAVTWDDALATARRQGLAGGRVHVGREDTPIARAVESALVTEGVDVEVLPHARPPMAWHQGTTALMDAAANGHDAVLADLIARGVDIDQSDVSGSTAIHHAAVRGNVGAIEALASAGSTIDRPNHSGMTPFMLARSTGNVTAARRLGELGASTFVGSAETITFSRFHAGSLYVWPLLPLVQIGVLTPLLWPLTVLDVAIIVVAVGALARLVGPPWAFLVAGCAPRQLEGTTLTARRFGGRRLTLDLTGVVAAAIAGSQPTFSGRGAHFLVLAHPDGTPISARGLRRLQLSAADVEALAGRLERVVVIALAGGSHGEVMLPVGNIVSASGAELSDGLRRQLSELRARAGR